MPVTDFVISVEEGQEVASARLVAIVESSFDAIIAKDLSSIITDWNPAAERLFGYTAAEAIGQPITMLIPEHVREEETEIIRRIRANERVESYETVRVRKDGTRVQVSLTVSPVRDARGRVIGASSIARDITATKENERRIRILLREINHRVKNQYAVILSIIRETGIHSDSIAEFQTKIRERISALSASHDLLVRSDWAGSTLTEVIQEQLAPFGHEHLVTVSGPLIPISATAVQNLGMAFHELGTNSAKYGVLSGRGGTISISWSITEGDEPELLLTWDERHRTPSPLAASPRRGFGRIVLDRVAPMGLGGRAHTELSPSAVVWSLTAPAAALTDLAGEA